MYSLIKIASVLSCGVLLCLGLSQASYAGQADEEGVEPPRTGEGDQGGSGAHRLWRLPRGRRASHGEPGPRLGSADLTKGSNRATSEFTGAP